MKVALTNLSNSKFEKSRHHLNKTAKRYGVTEVFSFDFEKDIKNTPFYYSNKAILSEARGIGYWLWKPYIILKVIDSLNEDDILIYSDCGIEIIGDLKPLISICKNKEPILLFANRDYVNAQFTKRDCFLLMNCDDERYWYSMQCDAAFMLFRKCSYTLQFLSEWMEFCRNKNIISDVANIFGKENLPGFIEHRHDQSVISLMAEKYNISLYRMPTHHRCNIFLPLKAARVHEGILSVATTNSRQLIDVESNSFPCSCHNAFTETTTIGNAFKENNEFKYDHLLSYLNSTYGKLLHHHRRKSVSRLYKLRFSIQLFLMKILLRFGLKLERV